MKKIFCLVLLAGVFIASQVFASPRWETYYLYLSNAASSTTTINSGVSTMIIEGSGINRSQGLSTIHVRQGSKIDHMVFQLYDSILCDAWEAEKGTKSSGATMTIGFKESIYDTDAHWAAAGASNFLSAVALSGTSQQIKTWDPTGLGHFKFYFTTGVTPFSEVTAVLRMYIEE